MAPTYILIVALRMWKMVAVYQSGELNRNPREKLDLKTVFMPQNPARKPDFRASLSNSSPSAYV